MLRRMAFLIFALLCPVLASAESSAKTLPYKYGFETTLATDGWTLTNPDGSDITAQIDGEDGRSGRNGFLFSSAVAVSPATAILISPELSVTAASHLIFYYRKKANDHSCSFYIGYSTNGTDPSNFTWSATAIDDATTTYKSYAYDIASGVKYVAFKFVSSTGAAMSLILDDLTVTAAACNSATNFRCTSRMSKTNGVRLEWTDNSDGYATYIIKKGDVEVATLDRGVTSYTFSDPLDLDVEHTYTLTTICGSNSLENPLSVTFRTSTGPKIEGYVCGGARMSDVNGSSRVTVVNCEHLYAVYGGNDIAGEVKALTSHYIDDNPDDDIHPYKGAEVIIGDDTKSKRVFIDYVYGGGSGLYYYPGIGTSTTETTGGTSEDIKYSDGITSTGFTHTTGQVTSLRSLSTNGEIKGYYNLPASSGITTIRENVFATLAVPDGGTFPSIPTVAHTRIFVNSDNVYIDSLFGGAENAQVGKDVVNALASADTSVSITINKGTVFAVFGGNNYGGLLGKGTYQHIVVNGTSKNPASSLALGGDKTTGKSHKVTDDVYSLVKTNTGDIYAHGIRYLFGGGNIVEGQNVHIEIKGGQIDTLFGGGNSADVASTTVKVDVTDPIYSSYSASYSPSTSTFDIRCLFGGNNVAHMYSVPKINLTNGGIHTLYGGGNKGVILGGEDYADNDAVYAYTGEGSPAANAKRSTVIESDGSVTVDTIFGGGQSAGTLNDTYVHLTGEGTYGSIFGGTNILGNIGYQGSDGLGRYETSPSSGVFKEYAKTNIYLEWDGVSDEYLSVKGSVFGGSNGFYMVPSADGKRYSSTRIYPSNSSYDYLGPHDEEQGMFVPQLWQTNLLVSGINTTNSIYGGGNLAPVGATYNNEVTNQSEGNTVIRITGGNITDYGLYTAAVYGGGNYANIFGNATIEINGSGDYPPLIDNVFGGNDKAGTVTGGPSRDGYSTLASADNISWDSLPSFMATEGGYSIANNHQVHLTKDNAASYILVSGIPYIYSLYGGGNGHYDYFHWDNDTKVYSNGDTEAEDAFFNESAMIPPNQTNSFVDLNVSENGVDEIVSNVYGGGNFATVGDDVVINGMTFDGGYPSVWLNAVNQTTTPEVDYLFGGNNHVNMSVVPRIYLLKGAVGEVYGGGNEGGMTGSLTLNNGDDYSVSTCVMMVSDDADVRTAIFGGCNVADVSNHTYIGLKRGTVNASVFGGNNIAGGVPMSHIDIFGSDAVPVTVNGEVFGGGKGDYTYTPTDPGDPASGFGVEIHGDVGNIDYTGVASRPYTEVTKIRVANTVVNDASATAVTMNGNIFGGGLAGGCRQTIVDINAPAGVFDCSIFGGGKGIISQIGNANSSFDGYAQVHAHEGTTRRHAGNIHTHTSALASTNVHIRQMKSMNIDASSHRHAIFGGGYSGDVNGNTYVTLYETNTARIPAVYLGGVAADVTGTATGVFDGYDTPALRSGRNNIVDTIYGGNDFTGRVGATDLTVNSGVYQHLFGAGNGDYVFKDALAYSAANITDFAYDTVPYTMKVDVKINNGLFRGNVYGGGNMGLVGYRDMNPTNMLASIIDRYANLGMIHLVINDGEFRRHVFGGARGKSNMKDRFFGTSTGTHNNVDGMPLGAQLVYGIKQVDMYGGDVYFSLHGGSESVDDGYPFECIGPTDANTNYYKNLGSRASYGSGSGQVSPSSTLRPSSIVNIIGGHVRKSLYGGGYQGNIYGSVFVNIGAEAVNDAPLWTKFSTMQIDGSGNTVASLKPSLLTVTNPIKLDASVYNCADWGEAGDKAYFNTRGVFGGETNVIIDGEGYNTTNDVFYTGSKPEMTIAHSVIGTGTSTEGGDINRLIVMRNYGEYVCPRPRKALYSIQRADKVVLDNVYLNLYGEQDAFESYASPNFSLNRLDTLVLCNDNVLNIESPANYIGLHASLKNISDVYHLTSDISATSPNLVTNVAEGGVAQTSDNLASNDILDNQVEATCTASDNPPTPETGCDQLDVCALVPTNRGELGRPGKYNTIIIDQGAYMKISPFIDVWDNRTINNVTGRDGRDGVDDNEDTDNSHEHDYGHVFGYTYLVAPLETMGYVYGIYKYGSNNSTDGGFVSPCYCNNQGTYPNEIDYSNVSTTGLYRTWKIGTFNGLRKRSATLIANKEPDQILNWSLSDGNYKTSYNNAVQSGTANYNVNNGNNFAYATAAIELPPAKEGNFYIVQSIEIDQANGGEMRLIDEGYEAISNSVFKAWQSSDLSSSDLASSSQDLASIANGDHNLSFGLTMSSINGGGRVTNFADYGTCWTGTTTPPLYEVTTASGPIDRDIAKWTIENGVRTLTDPVEYYKCWPITSISGGAYFNSIGGYISNAVTSSSGIAEGIIPRIVLTLTYDTRLTNTIARDVKFRMLEYDKEGNYQGPIDVTVTITTVIRDFSDIEAPVLAMYNEGISNEYVRRINIPASFLQRDLYLEDIKWERNTDHRFEDQNLDHFHLQAMTSDIVDETHFAIKVSPIEMVSSTLNNHLGWYDIVEENRNIDLYALAQEDHIRRTGSPLTAGQSVNYTSWDITPDAVSHLDDAEGHYDGTMPSYGHENYTGNTWGDANGSEWYDDRITSTSLHGKEGIKLGTLDGRAPATLDVTLKYDGNRLYHDHYSDGDPGPLAWAYLKLHWYNTNIEKEGDDNDGIFWVKVKLRTREKGDTIYMAPGNELTRSTIESESRTMRCWNHTDHNQTASIETYAQNIRNNPDMYVKTFPEAMRIYREGDVLDIMETIEIGNGNPLTVGNNDNVGIQIIRYSGSHYKFPSLGCANPNVMVKVNDGGRIAFRNIRFNGSGATRVKKREASAREGDNIHITDYYYNDKADRVKAIYFAESPMLQCDGTGQLSLTNDVSLINNYNKKSSEITGYVGGGAIAITNGGLVTMGDNTVIRDNLVVNNGTIKNFGGAVYVDGGVLRVGPQVEDAECDITIEHNYNYMGSNVDNVLNETVPANLPAGFMIAGDYAYRLDTAVSATLPNNFSLSNVYLTRTPVSLAANDITAVSTGTTAQEMSNILKVRGDVKNDRIYFTGALSEGSRIGISKWFPGYIYKPSNTLHHLYNTVPRDTVSVAVLTGSTKVSLAEENYRNNVFFNDSNYFAQTSGTRSFALNNNYTTYHSNSNVNYPSYNDKVYNFYHNYVDDKTLYFQRCASFGKGVSKQLLAYTANSTEVKLSGFHTGDSMAFCWNPDATCNVISDTIVFKVGGGFFPYTYHWDVDSVLGGTFAEPELYRKRVRKHFTHDPNSISNFNVSSYADKRKAAERDTLVLYDLDERLTELQSTYFFQVSAEDVTGHCSVTQPVMVRVVKNENNATMADANNFLLHGETYQVHTPGVDSSGFQDHTDIDGRNRQPSGTTTIDATYKVKSGNNWVDDESGNAPASDLYASNLVPRYMRSYLSFTVQPSVMPTAASDVLEVRGYPGIPGTGEGSPLNLATTRFCPGTMLYLTPRKKAGQDSSHWEYMSWDFDPSSGRNTTFVVGNSAEANQPTVYYAPNDYWWQVVRYYRNEDVDGDANTATKRDYETDYYGNVTIKTNKGLAWLISVVNGYNGQSARTMHFNTVTISPDVSAAGLDMQAHKWTPVGNQNNPFEGTFAGNDKTVSGLIINEETLPRVGMFGYTDQATIGNLNLSKVQMKGNSYVGGLVAHANKSNIDDVQVKDGILFTEYVAGGLVGKSENEGTIKNPIISQPSDDKLTVKGNAIYFGGIVGDVGSTNIYNPVVHAISQDYLSAIYSGSYVGTSCTTQVNGKAIVRNEIHNGYAHIKSTGNAERLGGLVGRAEGLNLYNCYVYGEAKATEFTGALAGYVGSNVDISNCYYVDGLTNQVVGYGTSSAVQKSSSFHGSGKQVLLTNRVDGYNNLLRALNGWVNAQNNPVYKHWRPAHGDENSGYPLFGDPEMIEVFDTVNIAACDSYDFDGITLTQSGTYVMHFVDSTDYLDSTVTLMLTVNYGDSIEVSDTVLLGQGYEGYGFTLSADEVRDAFGGNMQNEVATMMYIDNLLTVNGCDSLVFLTLYIINNNTDIDNSQLSTVNYDVKIYPNPTRSMVNVEGDGLLSVEVYDNISRRVLTRTSDGKENLIKFDMSQQAAGSYYIRVKTSHGTVVKKLIKK